MSDKDLIDLLCKDRIFKESIEEEFGPLKEIFPDWDARILVYSFGSGTCKYTLIDPLLEKIKEIDYESEFKH